MRSASERRVFLTGNGFHRDQVISLLQKSLRRKERELAYQAAKEILQGDHLRWADILTFLFEDHCLSGTGVLSFFFEQYTRKGNQAKFSCIAMMLDCCKPCRLAPCMASNTYEAKHLVTGTEESLTGLVEPEEGHVNVDIVLTQLAQAWKTKKWEQVLAYMKVVATVVYTECHIRTVTEKGKEYMLPTNTPAHVTLVVLSVLYKHTVEKEMTNYLQTCYDLATVHPSDSFVLCLLLFSVVACYKHGFEVIPSEHTAIPDWLDICDLKRIPDWAITLETSTCQASEKPRNEKIDYYLTEGVLCSDQVETDNPFAVTFGEMCMKFMIRRLRGAMAKAFMFHRLALGSNLVHGDEVKCVSWRSRRDALRKRKSVSIEEPQAKRKNTTDLKKGEEVKGPFPSLLKMRHVLFIHDSMISVLKDTHTLPVSQRGTDHLVYPLIASGSRPLNKMPGSVIEALPHTVWVHFVFRYSFGLKDSALHNAVVCSDTGNVYGIGMEIGGLPFKDTSIITDILFSRVTKKRLIDSTLASMKKHKVQILQHLANQNPCHEIKRLAFHYGVYFDDALFKKKIDQVVSLLNEM